MNSLALLPCSSDTLRCSIASKLLCFPEIRSLWSGEGHSGLLYSSSLHLLPRTGAGSRLEVGQRANSYKTGAVLTWFQGPLRQAPTFSFIVSCFHESFRGFWGLGISRWQSLIWVCFSWLTGYNPLSGAGFQWPMHTLPLWRSSYSFRKSSFLGSIFVFHFYLLWSNKHNIKFTLFKCTVHWHLVN